MTGLMRLALRRSVTQVRHVTAVPAGAAEGKVAAVYAQSERDLGGLTPSIALHSPSPDLLVAAWMMLREALIVPGASGRAAKEAMATTVSERNSCPYCVEMHAAAMVALPGISGAGGDPVELTAVAATFHYLNRMVNVFLGDSPIPHAVPDPARRYLRSLLGRLAKPKGLVLPGDSLGLLPAATLPRILHWARPNQHLAAAFARAAAAFDAAGVRSIPLTVRELVLAELADWEGEPRGPGAGWADGPLAGIPAEDRAAGRLALLTAMASYQIDEHALADFRATVPGDIELIELTGWAAFTAATAAAAREHRERDDGPT